MRGSQLVLCVTVFLDGFVVLCDVLIFQDFPGHFVATLFDLPADVVLCVKMVAVMFGAEGFHKYEVTVVVVR